MHNLTICMVHIIGTLLTLTEADATLCLRVADEADSEFAYIALYEMQVNSEGGSENNQLRLLKQVFDEGSLV